ncbi:phage tail assembly chaperone [Gluconobacter albidus]|uniref:Uncharacterized protein n=1 Tax=Gluconobacter albidus TaxID=318683 RepID=A0AAW3QZ64_9PROT|nr:hypothetical protein [Gluconobacter albidus]KXV39469.1 hypothetical protein AD941_05100 [Gluconobacter albidus]GBQ90919.1 hypothetical protein AA3250_2169 [Gluconobacter albidus NBRC 3250]GLQ69363.1 hypothetical protein GCM10007866_18140 [Gluconobacter albidus]
MKSIEWTPASGADLGKRFTITRMPAFAADKWARHTIKALIKAGAKIPDTAMEAGIVGMGGVAMQMFGFMDNDDCDAAFQALLDCVQIQRPGGMPARILDLDIDDPQTLSDLRTEAFKLHVGFFKAAALQISPLAAALFPQTSPENPPAA